jgi:hypothetical protein
VDAGRIPWLESIWGLSARDIWAVGGAAAALHWDGEQWTSTAVEHGDTYSLPELNALWARAPDDLWAVGVAGAIIRWDGTRWRRIRSGTAKDIVAVWGAEDGQIWAVTEGAGILHLAP